MVKMAYTGFSFNKILNKFLSFKNNVFNCAITIISLFFLLFLWIQKAYYLLMYFWFNKIYCFFPFISILNDGRAELTWNVINLSRMKNLNMHIKILIDFTWFIFICLWIVQIWELFGKSLTVIELYIL